MQNKVIYDQWHNKEDLRFRDSGGALRSAVNC